MNDTVTLDVREISSGVAEVYDGSYQIGLITWDPNRMTTQWFASYANGDETLPCADRDQAVLVLRIQHQAVQRLARSIRSIRPASEARQQDPRGISWDYGYNTALRDAEKILTEVVGLAPQGEGYTAITGTTEE
jgi:hypothetical protein